MIDAVSIKITLAFAAIHANALNLPLAESSRYRGAASPMHDNVSTAVLSLCATIRSISSLSGKRC